MAAGKRYRKKRHNVAKLVFCAAVELIVVLILVLIIGWNQGIKSWFLGLSQPAVKELDLSGIYSTHAILMPAQGGRVIGEINGDERIYPASLTKMMTAILAIEKIGNLNKEITLTNEMFAGLYEQDATQAGFQPGEVVSAENLIYGAMLPSGAECCIALAEAVAGSELDFVELMNKKAAKLGMDHTHFCDTTGLHDPEHYSTVRDMAILLKYCIRNDKFREIAGSSWHYTGVTNVHPDGITYYNTLFKNLSTREVTGGEILGGKTGYTDDAGLCLASYAEIMGKEYVLVTAGAAGGSGQALHVMDAVTIYNRLGEVAQALQR